MSQPLVSVCLPNLNARQYLRERVDTILAQTYTNWELVVSDNYSDDGAWEFFEELARQDDRVAVAQAPREGMYANWNNCITRAKGEYVYIATSDDTMAADCLERLVAALEAHPRCGLAHCALRKIDERASAFDWWSRDSVFARSSGPLLHRPHIRRAPFDGLLHLLGWSVYISVTQLLIRRSLFDRIGSYPGTWGSVGDFNWNMRASLVADVVHVPDTWGGWRTHQDQATAAAALRSPAHAERVEEMIAHAVAECGHLLAPVLREHLASEWLPRTKQLRAFNREIGRRRGALSRRALIVRRALAGVTPARERLKLRLLGRSFPDVLRSRLEAVAEGPALVPENELRELAPG
jgi:Glycosyl transferase family 2